MTSTESHVFVPPEPLGERFKERETYLEKTTPPWKYIILRFDGHSFSKFTNGFRKPFDINMTNAIRSCMMDAVKEYSFILGYCQSDEISLIYPALCSQKEYEEMTEKHPTHPFNGRINKLISLVASYISVRFNFHIMTNVNKEANFYSDTFLDKINKPKAHFDGRALIFDKTETIEMLNYFVWRQNDCYRNCTSAFARHILKPAKQLVGKKMNDMLELLNKSEFNYNEVDNSYKIGIFAKKELFEKEAFNHKTNKKEIAIRSEIISKVVTIKATPEYEYILTQKYWTI